MSTAQHLWGLVGAELVMFGLFWLLTMRIVSSRENPGMLALALSNLCLGASLLLVAMRGLMPDLLTQAGANILTVAGLAALWRGGTIQFTGQIRREPLIVLGVSAIALMTVQLLWPKHPDARVAALFLSAAWMIARIGWFGVPLLGRRAARLPLTGPLLLLAAGLSSAWLAVRALGGLLLGWPLQAHTSTTSSFVTAFGVLIALTLVNTLLAYAILLGLVRELQRMASHDTLTGLLNRRALWECLERRWQSWRRSQQQGRFALLCVDIDHFKSINDNHGHAVGDQVLMAVAVALRQQSRPSDDVARIGGEEFVLVLGGAVDEHEVGAVAERLRQAIQQMARPAELGDRIVTASFGLVLVETDDEQPSQLLARGDRALYQAKADGRNCIRLARSMRQPLRPSPQTSATEPL